MTGVPRQCTATSTQSGERCRRAPVNGASVCATHGGRAPQVQAAAAERVAEEQSRALASKAVAEWSPDLVPQDPGDVLLKATHATWMQALAHRQQLIQLENAQTNPFVRLDRNGREYPSALALLEHKERQLAADLAAKAVGADLMGRHLRLMERYGDSVAEVAEAMVREFAPALDVSDPEVRRRIRRVLLSVAGEAGAA